ncbi:MAG: OmpA family protein [bacterium]|nr:OmpA family protein [bacterium]
MKSTYMVVGILMLALIAGCGVNKDYVAQQIADSEGRTDSKISGLRDKTDANASEIARLQSLAQQLSDKTDMAINEAKGFENYQVIWSGEIKFDFDATELNESAAATMMEAGEAMEKNAGSIIEIAGHTDRTGAAKYNYMLGQERAQSAKRYLNDKFGFSLYRMFVISYGESRPLALPDETKAASQNRRVTLKVWGNLK